ncbi:MAG: ubiquinone/menaquinone biosynthesis methyltransferase [Acidimicrobiales bacterium]|nr:MAG: ubiquinone/menaquinone biosynthesis methyltransferase [Acidimicrobiales bacterium]
MTDVHGERLASIVSFVDADVLDVGCGAGALVRWMRTQGARPVGAECSETMREMACTSDPDHREDYLDAVAQDLPFPDASFDIVVFSYSLHHVPADAMTDGLREARRVLRPGGSLVSLEPIPEGAEHDIAALIDDETEVRRLAQLALDDVTDFEPLAHLEYESHNDYADWDAWETVVVGIDATRASAMNIHRDAARELFETTAERQNDGGYRFTERNLLRVFTAV